MDDDSLIGLWYSTDGGRTIDKLGPESGYILRDEELGDPEEPEDADARLTLEQGRVENPGFFVTAQLYGGWFFVTVKRSTQADADTLYAELRVALERLAELLPRESDRNVPQKLATLNTAIADLEARFNLSF